MQSSPWKDSWRIIVWTQERNETFFFSETHLLLIYLFIYSSNLPLPAHYAWQSESYVVENTEVNLNENIPIYVE
jgi:hypothetical protein